ncbi:MAG: hypothetical protein H3C34_08295 [Caldilineaceae bacterium]|nr:hypothetical protein [Caldilineaceae bacterium]
MLHRSPIVVAGAVLVLLSAACAPVSNPNSALQATATPASSSQQSTEPSALEAHTPSFSHPTQVTNPYLPYGLTHYAVFLGEAGGSPFRAELRLLPRTESITWDGGTTDNIVIQYSAFSDGHLVEVAYDYYAQADDGSVYYFGEDVYNYEDGKVVDQDGSWLAGRDGAPPAVMMPAQPQTGMVYHPENLPGVVFETDEIIAMDAAVTTPATGAINNGLRVQETLMDGAIEYKTYGLNFGELMAEAADETSQLALFIPVEAAVNAIPEPLAAMEAQAQDIFDSAPQSDWTRIERDVISMNEAWQRYDPQSAPRPAPAPFLHKVETAIAELESAVASKDLPATRQAANDLSEAAVDLFAVYNPSPPADLGRLAMLERQVMLDVQAGDYAAAANSLAVTDAIWVRMQADVRARNGADVASHFSASISAQAEALHAQDDQSVILEAQNGLELVGVVEKLFQPD